MPRYAGRIRVHALPWIRLTPAAVGEVAAVILPGVASGPSQRCKLRHGAMHGGEQRATVTLAGTGAHMGLVAVGDGCQSAVLAHLVV